MRLTVRPNQHRLRTARLLLLLLYLLLRPPGKLPLPTGCCCLLGSRGCAVTLLW